MNVGKRTKLILLDRLVRLAVLLICFWLLVIGCQYSDNKTISVTRHDIGSFVTTVTPPIATSLPTRVTESVLDLTSTPSCSLINDFGNFLLYQGSDNTYRKLIIYSLRLDGTIRTLIEGQLILGQPWSPTARMFIFINGTIHPSNSDIDLSVIDLCTGEVEIIKLLRLPHYVYWSPDGHYLLYTAAGQNNTVGIVLYNFEVQESQIISEVDSERFWLSGWSPDSKKIAFVSKQNGQYDLYTLNIETLAVQQITDSPAIEALVYWSPTNNHLLVGTFPSAKEYSLDSDGPIIDTFNIFDESGSQLSTLGTSYSAWTAAWSPDGEKIAYSNNGGLCIIDVEEQSENCPLEELFPAEDYSIAFSEPAVWSADGNWFAFQLIERHKDLCALTYILELSTNTIIEPDQQMCLGSPLYWPPRP